MEAGAEKEPNSNEPSGLRGECIHILMAKKSHFRAMSSHGSTLDWTERAQRCAECRVLLRLIDQFKPGWLAGDGKTRGVIDVSRDDGGAYIVEMYLPLPGQCWRETELSGAFEFFHRSTGTASQVSVKSGNNCC